MMTTSAIIQPGELGSSESVLPSPVEPLHIRLEPLQRKSMGSCHRSVRTQSFLPDYPQEGHLPLPVCSGPNRKLQSQTDSRASHPGEPSWLPSLLSAVAKKRSKNVILHWQLSNGSFYNNFTQLWFSSHRNPHNKQLNGASFYALFSIFRNKFTSLIQIKCGHCFDIAQHKQREVMRTICHS